jgi:hypothetical protein
VIGTFNRLKHFENEENCNLTPFGFHLIEPFRTKTYIKQKGGYSFRGTAQR